MSKKARKRLRRKLRRRIAQLDNTISLLWRKLHRRPPGSAVEETILRSIRIREHLCAEAMSAFYKVNTKFDAEGVEASIRRADALIAKYGG